ncbi:RHS repeat-associated core domain-containing protein [Streptomyces sp. NPDC005731]|uniref:RHS repeat-associated core domain-containing protein n=1 Tax=Streptomyces sp. NPDC005731 TaxID=3157056 RepID=UPI0033DA8553
MHLSSTGSTDNTRILYLFGGTEQITLNVSAKTCTGLRNITGPDGTTVTRSSTGTVSYTVTTAIDASSLAVTRRYYDPYGNPRGAKPTTWVASDENHGYLGKPTDTTTGLDLLGARNYDPAVGRFLTPDPVFEAGDRNQMGGYAYAGDNPASGSDPSGLMLDGGGDCRYQAGGCNSGSGTHSGGGSRGGGSSTDTSSGGNSTSPTPSPSPGTLPTPGPYPPAPKDVVVNNPPTNLVVTIAKSTFDLANCEFWITGGGQDHDDSCDVAGGVYPDHKCSRGQLAKAGVRGRDRICGSHRRPE